MSTSIVTIQKPSYLATTAPVRSELVAGISEGMSLPVLSVRGKEFRMRFQGQEANMNVRELDCILVRARAGLSKRFYKGAYVRGEVRAPDCSSADGLTPDVSEPVASSCATCPNNMWGSKITESGKQGKLCDDYKRVVLLPVINGQVSNQPVVLDIAATSLKSPKGYQGRSLFLREYGSLLARHNMPEQAAISRLGFTDAEYPQVCFSFVRQAEEAEYNLAMAMRESPEVLAVLEAGAHEGEAVIVESPAPVNNARPIAPEPVAPAHVEAAPVQAAAPAEPVAEVSGDDVMAEVRNLLKGLS